MPISKPSTTFSTPSSSRATCKPKARAIEGVWTARGPYTLFCYPLYRILLANYPRTVNPPPAPPSLGRGEKMGGFEAHSCLKSPNPHRIISGIGLANSNLQVGKPGLKSRWNLYQRGVYSLYSSVIFRPYWNTNTSKDDAVKRGLLYRIAGETSLPWNTLPTLTGCSIFNHVARVRAQHAQLGGVFTQVIQRPRDVRRAGGADEVHVEEIFPRAAHQRA